MTFPVERKVQIGFGLLLACLIAVGAVSWLAVERLYQSASNARRAQEIISRLELLLSTATDAESAHRGYVITGDTSFLDQQRQAHMSATSELEQLRRVFRENLTQQERVSDLTAVLGDRFTFMDRVIELRSTGGYEPAAQLIGTGVGRELHSRLRSIVDDIQTSERLLLRERQRRAQMSANLAQGVILVGIALALIFVALALLAILRDFAGRRRAERALREATEQLEVRVRERTAELAYNERLLEEVGQLAKVGGWDLDPVTRRARWTPELARIHDVDPSVEPTVEMALQFYPPEARAQLESALQWAIEHGKPYDLELEFISAKGVRKWVRAMCRPVMEKGKVVRLRGALQDITERKRTETKLRTQVVQLALLSQITRAIGERQDTQSIFQIVVRTLEELMPLNFSCICLYEPSRDELIVTSMGIQSAELGAELALGENAASRSIPTA